MVKTYPTGLDGVVLIEPRRFGDERGFFLETFRHDSYLELGVREALVQDNHSRSARGTLRGMHFQVKRPQAQMVTVMRGRIFDVAVDLRARSSSFGRWFGAELSADDGPCQIYMAPGFAHGFYVMSDFADLHYKVSRYYDREDEGGLSWNDTDVGVAWPADPVAMSPRDSSYPRLSELTPAMLPHDPPVEA